jgi:hypothetical protein
MKGFVINNTHNLSTLAFADDLILVATTTEEALTYCSTQNTS